MKKYRSNMCGNFVDCLRIIKNPFFSGETNASKSEKVAILLLIKGMQSISCSCYILFIYNDQAWLWIGLFGHPRNDR